MYNVNPIKVSSKRTAVVFYSGQDDRFEAVTKIKVNGYNSRTTLKMS